ncbi:PilZ domain-containing protein [Tsuneonella sp. SYSU-LHT278]|uniref:PilZ domain-containing protein n=1 Tax=Tsuneonella sediminis TaxID=3416089 RepID=UPI003F793598
MHEGRARRRLAFVKAKLRKGDGWQDVQIGNVSSTGLLVRLADPPAAGETVELRHRGCCVIGKVIWKARSRMGIRSLEPIDVEALLADSGIGPRPTSEALYEAPHPSFWKRLRGRWKSA